MQILVGSYKLHNEYESLYLLDNVSDNYQKEIDDLDMDYVVLIKGNEMYPVESKIFTGGYNSDGNHSFYYHSIHVEDYGEWLKNIKDY